MMRLGLGQAASKRYYRRMSQRFTARVFALLLGLVTATASVQANDGAGQAAGQAGGQSRQMPVYRAGVDLVVLNVAVLDNDGESVVGLTAADFRMAEDGVGQEITLFASSSNTPLDVALVLDMSGSIAMSAPTVKQDAQAFLAALGSEDCVYFVPFREDVGAGTWSAPDEPALVGLIDRLPLQGGTALYDALGRALRNIDRMRYENLVPGASGGSDWRFDGPYCGAPLPPPNLGVPGSVRRTAVVVLSDGGDEHSLSTYADTLVNAWSGPVPIFSVAVGEALEPRRRSVGGVGTRRNRFYRVLRARSEALENRLGQLAHITGGRLVLGRGRERVREAFDEVVKMLRSSYLIGYNAPPEAGGAGPSGLSWHAIDVEIPDHDVELFVRPGYYRNLYDTDGAAQIVREAPGLVAGGRHADALEQLDLALRLDPGYWPIYLQRARALLQGGRREEARDDLLTTLDLRPGLSSAHVLLADTAFELGDWQLAWYHAIRAAQDGIDVTPLLRALIDVSEAPVDLAEQLRAVRIAVDIGATPDELDQATMLELLRALRREMSAASDIALVSRSNYANAAVILEVEEVKDRPRKLEGELVVNGGPYDAMRREKLEIDNLDDAGEIAAGVAEAAQKVREWIENNRR